MIITENLKNITKELNLENNKLKKSLKRPIQLHKTFEKFIYQGLYFKKEKEENKQPKF